MTLHFFLLGGLLLAALGGLATAWYCFRLNPPRIPAAEQLTRNRYWGSVIALLALAWCVPQGQALAWDWLLPYLWPLVGIFTVLAFFFLDYLFARAIGGLLILAAYYFLQESFALDIKLALSGAVLAWSIGLIGILISAKPCYLRDAFPFLARHGSARYAAVGYALLITFYCGAAIALNWKA